MPVVKKSGDTVKPSLKRRPSEKRAETTAKQSLKIRPSEKKRAETGVSKVNKLKKTNPNTN